MVQRTDRELGEGSSGRVRVAKYKGQSYAAKEFNNYTYHKLCREVCMLSQLQHKNVVTFHGIGCYEDFKQYGFLILTELLATTLYRYLRDSNRIPVRNQISILSDVLGGLEHMHESPAIIHCDLKTNNIYLSKDGVAKIGDLGSSVLEDDEVQIFCSTPYAAPEISSNRKCTTKVDMFAYGHLSLVVLTQLEKEELSDNAQQDSSEPEVSKRSEYFHQLQSENFSLIKNFIPLIQSCLSYEPQLRPSVAELKCRMLDLKLPCEAPNVQVDTAVLSELLGTLHKFMYKYKHSVFLFFFQVTLSVQYI